MKKKLLCFLLCGVVLIGLTGCGGNDSSTTSIQDELNGLMDKLEQESDDFHVSTIQDYLENNSDFRLIAGDDEEFTERPSSSIQQYTVVQEREQLINTNSDYVLIYNVKTDKYYSIPMGAVGLKPYFNEATELK
jgi:hypothetical protein